MIVKTLEHHLLGNSKKTRRRHLQGSTSRYRQRRDGGEIDVTPGEYTKMANPNASGGHSINDSVQNPRLRVAATVVGNNGSGHHSGRRRQLAGVGGGGTQAARAMLLNAVHAVADDGMEVILSIKTEGSPNRLIAEQVISPNHYAMCC